MVFLQAVVVAQVIGLVLASRTCCQPGQNCWPKFQDWYDLESSLSQGERSYNFPKNLFTLKSRNITGMRSLYLESEAAKLGLCTGPVGNPVSDEFCEVTFRNEPIPGVTPSAVVWPLTARDVQQTVLFVRKHNLCLCVTGTGHDWVGRHSSENHCVMIRTGLLREQAWDLSPTNKFGHADGVVRLGAGLQWGDVHKVSESKQRVVVSGAQASVGVVGWMLGGGHGELARWKGIGVDNVVEIDLVTADGSLVTTNSNATTIIYPYHADAEVVKLNDTELFWALRGGGGSTWGVITSITYRAHKPETEGWTLMKMVFHGARDQSGWELLSKTLNAYRTWAIGLSDKWGGDMSVEHPATFLSGWEVDLSYVYRGLPSDAEFHEEMAKLSKSVSKPHSNETSVYQTWWKKCLADDFGQGIYGGAVKGDSFFRIRSDVVLTRERMTNASLIDTIVYIIRTGHDQGIAINLEFQHTWYEGSPPGQSASGTCVSSDMRHAVASMLFAGAVTERELVPGRINKWVTTEMEPRVRELGKHKYFGESSYECQDWKEAYWGRNVGRLLKVKHTWDPELFFNCHHCIGDGSEPICPNRHTLPPRRPDDCIISPPPNFPGDDQYSEDVAFDIFLPKSTIAAMLPIGLEPVPIPGGNDDSLYPLTFNFGEDHHVGSPFTNFNYKELVVNIGAVQWDDQHSDKWLYYRGPFDYDVKLYLNESTEVSLGRKYVGDNKEVAYIGQTLEVDGSGSFVVVGRPGKTGGPYPGEVILSAKWKTHGPYWNQRSEYPQLSGPVTPDIGHYPPDDPSAPWECLPNYNYGDGVVTPASGSLTVYKPFVAGIPLGTHQFKALDKNGGGGYRQKARWDYANIPLKFWKTGCHSFNPADWPTPPGMEEVFV